MRHCIELGRVGGIQIGLHPTWLVAFALVAATLARVVLPAAYPGWGIPGYWLAGLAGALLLLVSAFIHGTGHTIAAVARGQHVRSITLHVFGGASDRRADGARPRDELLIAVAGPSANLAVAGLAWTVHAVTTRALPAGTFPLMEYLAVANLLLGLFNLLPGFPLDGGRALFHLAWMATGSRGQAACLVDAAGHATVAVFVAAGIWQLATGNLLGGLWLSFLGSLILR